ncbi:MAG TPA: DUF695 domain-containing protein, partial [Tepidisphaeraceae bacterium]|nr:DUF695 domain-containing protein [Tepidisphaeraceae bacterium]
MSGAGDKTRAPWLTAMAEYEGLPLALRIRPGADNPGNRSKFPRLVLVSHELDDASSNGLPAAQYNDSLADFDHAVHAAVERDGAGLLVLVETFSGKRNYYAYVADDGSAEQRIRELQTTFPQHKLRLRRGS